MRQRAPEPPATTFEVSAMRSFLLRQFRPQKPLQSQERRSQGESDKTRALLRSNLIYGWPACVAKATCHRH